MLTTGHMMKRRMTTIAALCLLQHLTFTVRADQQGVCARAESVLWYQQPAAKWQDAMPVGNGRLGAMVFGATAEERLQLNESTLWGGLPHDYSNPGAGQNYRLNGELKIGNSKS